MAFKTDQIKLKEDYAIDDDAGTPADGTLALIGNTGSKELKIRDGGNWVAISGGGGGAAELQDLNDVASTPPFTEDTVGVINGAGQLQFAKLSVDNIHVDSVNISGEWGNDDTTLATTAAIQDWVEGQSYLSSETFTELSQDASPELSADLIVGTNRIKYDSNPDTNELSLVTSWNGDPNHVHLQSVKSIELYLDSNQGNNGTEAIRVYNDINPNENTPDDTNWIWKLHENGSMYMTNDIDMGTNVITDAKVANWDATYTEVDAKANDWDTAVTWGNHAAAGYSTVDDLNDLSDVATPATLDATHVGKSVGVVSGGGTASVLTLDHSGIIDNFVTQNIYFEIGGQEYWIAYDGSNSISSDTSFTLQGSGIKRAMIDGTNVTNDGMGADIRALMAVFENGTESSAYTITGAGSTMTMTANSVGAAANIDYPSSTGSNLESGMSVTQIEGLDPQYQYELINTSGAPDPNWNHVQNSAWGGDLTIATNTASNLTWINTQNPGANELSIRQPSDYGAYAVITVMNASNNTMTIATVDNSFDFNCQQLNPTQSNSITLDAFQKAILVRTTGTDWDVVLASI